MGIEIKIDVELSPLQKRVVRCAVISGVVVAALGIGLAVAAPHQWTTNDALKATDLNSLNVIANDAGARQSVGATSICGITSPTQGDLSGLTNGVGISYAKARSACAVPVAGCSTTAHMCSAEEVLHSASLAQFSGLTVGTYYWYSTMRWQAGSLADDCAGWTTNANTPRYASALFVTTGNSQTLVQPSGISCDTSLSVLCCD